MSLAVCREAFRKLHDAEMSQSFAELMYFVCDDGTRVPEMHQPVRCDGISQCADGSDELFCNTGNNSLAANGVDSRELSVGGKWPEWRGFI